MLLLAFFNGKFDIHNDHDQQTFFRFSIRFFSICPSQLYGDVSWHRLCFVCRPLPALLLFMVLALLLAYAEAGYSPYASPPVSAGAPAPFYPDYSTFHASALGSVPHAQSLTSLTHSGSQSLLPPFAPPFPPYAAASALPFSIAGPPPIDPNAPHVSSLHDLVAFLTFAKV
eukprot:GHVT01042898.1.p1 GENE.GHVT01042898.1~~GHVT01042898.1.p1  ORF type:complete len:171 (-),score=20.25 GHVT01042898.1:2222-2734(-)